MHNAVYNSRIPDMLLPSPCFLRAASPLLIFIFLYASLTSASEWTTPEEKLAGKIAAVTGPGAVAVDVTNRSSLSPTDAGEIRRGLLTELAALGVRFVNAEQAAATVKVSLSEDLRSYVWIAEIQQGTNQPSVVMVSLPRPPTQSSGHETSALAIRKVPLWSQDDRILDVAVMDGNPSHMVVLDPNHITLYKFQDNRWQPEQALDVIHARPWPRDLRGRIVLRKDHLFDAYLPGVRCQGTSAAPLSINCRESDDPWPLGNDAFSLNAFFAPARNFFTGVLSPGIGKQTAAPAFYTATALPRPKYTLWLLSAVDGQLHLLDGITDQTGGKLGWGSDIATVRSSCGSGWQVLAARNGDGSNDGLRDAVRAFELPDREPVTVGQPQEIDGVITALWTASDGGSATAVSRNLETGRYEAFRLTMACSQ